MQSISNIFIITCFSTFAYLFLYSYESIFLPDYISYSYIYQFSNFYTFETYPFASFMRLFQSYDFFRFITLLAGLSLFFFKLISSKHNTYILLIILLFSLVFLFEFYMIRLRAGWSILFLAIAFFLRRKSLILALPFFLISGLFHLETTACLIFFIGIPYLMKQRPILVSVLASFIFLTAIIYAVPQRGLWVYSELNFARVLMHFLIIIFYLLINYKKTFKNTFLERMILLNISLSSTLIIFYNLGFTDISGEAIIRVTTLNIAIFLTYFLSTSNFKIKDILTPALYIIGSQLFFLNTVFFGF